MRFYPRATWIALVSILVGTCLGYILQTLPSWAVGRPMIDWLSGCAGWLTFYAAIVGFLVGVGLLGFLVWQMHKYESELRQDVKYETDKPKETCKPRNDKTIVREEFGLTQTISALALLALVAFVFSRRKKG